jgi:hypothetical protein
MMREAGAFANARTMDAYADSPCGVLRLRRPLRHPRRRALQDHHRKGGHGRRGPDRLPRLLQQPAGGDLDDSDGHDVPRGPGRPRTVGIPLPGLGLEPSRHQPDHEQARSAQSGHHRLGGTGSFLPDPIAKTPIHEIHPPDAGKLHTHNAFRGAPAASVEKLDAAPTKVDHYQRTFFAAAAWSPAGLNIIGCSAPPEHGNLTIDRPHKIGVMMVNVQLPH